MQGHKNYKDAQEETPMEETIKVSLEEYQRMKETITSMERVKGEEKNGKSVVDSANTPHFLILNLQLLHFNLSF